MIGLDHLYIGEKDYQEAQEYCSKDNDSSVVWFQNLQKIERGEFLDRPSIKNNLLMLAAAKCNVTLVTYILEHLGDPALVNLVDKTGAAAFDFVARQADDDVSTERTLICMQRLIDYGANPSAVTQEPGKSVGYNKETEEYNGYSQLGVRVELTTSLRTFEWSDEWAIDSKKIMDLLVSNGATCIIPPYGDIEVAQDEASDNTNITNTDVLLLYKAALQKARTAYNAIFWSRMRLLKLASLSPASSLAMLPTELQNRIGMAIFALKEYS